MEVATPADIFVASGRITLETPVDEEFVANFLRFDVLLSELHENVNKIRNNIQPEAINSTIDATAKISLPGKVSFSGCADWAPLDWVVSGKSTNMTKDSLGKLIATKKRIKLASSFPSTLSDLSMFSWERKINVWKINGVKYIKTIEPDEDLRSKLRGSPGKIMYPHLVVAEVNCSYMSGHYCDLLSFYSHKLFTATSNITTVKRLVYLNLLDPMCSDNVNSWVDCQETLVSSVKRMDTSRINTINSSSPDLLLSTTHFSRDLTTSLRSVDVNGSHLFRSAGL